MANLALGGGRAGDYVGGGRRERLVSPAQFHQEGGRVAAVALWVRISSGIDYAVFITVTLQNLGSSGLLGVRDGGRERRGRHLWQRRWEGVRPQLEKRWWRRWRKLQG